MNVARNLSIIARHGGRIANAARFSPSSMRCVSTLYCAAQTAHNGATIRNRRHLSDDGGSHSDFQPKRKVEVPEDVKEAMQMIETHIKDNPIMLYMKGSPAQPMCGFSAKVVEVLRREGCDFGSVNVLDYPSIREGIKQFSSWPTIPQLYVGGEFVGGCDIILSMHENGELAEMLGEISGPEKSE